MEESITQKITLYLWFDNNAEEATRFYTSIFNNSRIKNATTLHNTPSGTVEIFTVELLDQIFTLMSAGPLFKFNPSVSFLVVCNAKEQVETLWKKLYEGGGKTLMKLAEYPFSEKYGWMQDKYGLSWQLIFLSDDKTKERIIPTLMFVGNQCGKAEEAINFYTSVFDDSATIGNIIRYDKDEEPNKMGTIKHAAFTLHGQEFAAMDSASEHNFSFNEAISFIVHCETQEEIDYYWEKLSADKQAEQCGWLKDKYGISWQIVPNLMLDMLNDPDRNKISRVTEAFLQMKKLDIAKLKNAYSGAGK